MSAREWTETITSSPAVASVFDGISESAAQALCEAIEREVAPFAAELEAMRERAESAEARIAEVSGVTREQLAKREYERGLAEGKALRDDLLAALEAWQSLRFECVEDGSPAPRDGCECSVCDTSRESAAAIASAEGRS